MLNIRLGEGGATDVGWITDIGSFGDLTFSENWSNGCEQAQWGMQLGTRHRLLRPGMRVQIRQFSVPLWTGTLAEPGGGGSFVANGLWRLGEGVPALDNSDAPTSDADTAVRRAVATGRVPWTFSAINAGALGDAEATHIALTALLDRYTEKYGVKWRVDHTGELVLAPQGAPVWMIRANADLLATSATNYVSHLVVTYMAGVGSFPSFTHQTTASAEAGFLFGPKYEILDLTEQGIITLGEAQTAATGVLDQMGTAMVLAEPLRLLPGQLRTLGDSPVGWGNVHAGQVVRVHGVVDRTRGRPIPYTDVPIGRLERTSNTLTLTAQGAPARNFTEVVAALTAAAAA
jgi:hypothetical protein